MTTFALILFLAVLAVGYLTARAIQGDGYGRRQPPVSHYPDMFDPTGQITGQTTGQITGQHTRLA